MIKIYLLLMVISMPGMPSVKYNAALYPTMDDCLVAREGYMATYHAKDQSYKDKLHADATCLEFESFPIQGLPGKPIGMGT
tara:strand:- start:35 stop:277 length:243 start_codon:yes stop_codon:yes gene_type:complete